MSGITLKGPLATLAVVGSLLAAAGPVSASPRELSSTVPIGPTKDSFSIDIGTSERIAIASSTVVTDNKDPDKRERPRQQADGIIAILIG